MPLIHFLSVGQLRSCPLTTAAQASLVGFHLSLEDSQLNLLVINLEDGCQYSTKSVKDYNRHLGVQLVDLDPVGAHPPVHDVFSMHQLHVPLLKANVRGIISLDNLVQRDHELFPPLLGVLPQLFDGREDDHSILHGGIDVNYLGTLRLLQLSDSGLQTIILESMFSFLANKETEHTDPVLLPSDHGPKAIPQTSRIAHGTR